MALDNAPEGADKSVSIKVSEKPFRTTTPPEGSQTKKLYVEAQQKIAAIEQAAKNGATPEDSLRVVAKTDLASMNPDARPVSSPSQSEFAGPQDNGERTALGMKPLDTKPDTGGTPTTEPSPQDTKDKTDSDSSDQNNMDKWSTEEYINNFDYANRKPADAKDTSQPAKPDDEPKYHGYTGDELLNWMANFKSDHTNQEQPNNPNDLLRRDAPDNAQDATTNDDMLNTDWPAQPFQQEGQNPPAVTQPPEVRPPTQPAETPATEPIIPVLDAGDDTPPADSPPETPPVPPHIPDRPVNPVQDDETSRTTETPGNPDPHTPPPGEGRTTPPRTDTGRTTEPRGDEYDFSANVVSNQENVSIHSAVQGKEAVRAEMRKGRWYHVWRWPGKIGLRLTESLAQNVKKDQLMEAGHMLNTPYFDIADIKRRKWYQFGKDKYQVDTTKALKARQRGEKENQAIVGRFQEGTLAQGEKQVEAQGQLRTQLINEIMKPVIDGTITSPEEVQKRLAEFVKNNLNDPQVKELFGAGANKFGDRAEFFATDVFFTALRVKETMAAKDKSLDDLDQYIHLKLGVARSGIKTDIRDFTDRKIAEAKIRQEDDKLRGMGKGVLARLSGARGVVWNPLFVGIAASLGTQATLRGIGVAARLGAVATGLEFVTGGAAGGVVAGLRSYSEKGRDRAFHMAQRAGGQELTDETPKNTREKIGRFVEQATGGMNRAEMEATSYNIVTEKQFVEGGGTELATGRERQGLQELENQARNAKQKLDANPSDVEAQRQLLDARGKLITRAGEYDTRTQLSDMPIEGHKSIDLIRYSSAESANEQSLLLKRAGITLVLRETGMSNEQIDPAVTESIAKWKPKLVEKIKQKDVDFDKQRLLKSIQAGATGGIFALLGGLGARAVTSFIGEHTGDLPQPMQETGHAIGQGAHEVASAPGKAVSGAIELVKEHNPLSSTHNEPLQHGAPPVHEALAQAKVNPAIIEAAKMHHGMSIDQLRERIQTDLQDGHKDVLHQDHLTIRVDGAKDMVTITQDPTPAGSKALFELHKDMQAHGFDVGDMHKVVPSLEEQIQEAVKTHKHLTFKLENGYHGTVDNGKFTIDGPNMPEIHGTVAPNGNLTFDNLPPSSMPEVAKHLKELGFSNIHESVVGHTLTVEQQAVFWKEHVTKIGDIKWYANNTQIPDLSELQERTQNLPGGKARIYFSGPYEPTQQGLDPSSWNYQQLAKEHRLAYIFYKNGDPNQAIAVYGNQPDGSLVLDPKGHGILNEVGGGKVPQEEFAKIVMKPGANFDATEFNNNYDSWKLGKDGLIGVGYVDPEHGLVTDNNFAMIHATGEPASIGTTTTLLHATPPNVAEFAFNATKPNETTPPFILPLPWAPRNPMGPLEPREGEEFPPDIIDIIYDPYGHTSEEELRFYNEQMSERLRQNPDANLDASIELPDYFRRQSPEYMQRLDGYLQQPDMRAPMNERCDAVVCMPVYTLGEGQNIQKTLENYLLQVDGAHNNQAIDPSKIELILFLNYPMDRRHEYEVKELGGQSIDSATEIAAGQQRVANGTPANHDTELVIKKFIVDHPELNIRIMNQTYSTRPSWGKIIKPLYDVAMLRSMRRRNPANKDPLIITNDADVERMSPTYLRDMLQEADFNTITAERDPSVRKVDGFVGKIDMPNHGYEHTPGFLAAERLYEYFDAQTRRNKDSSGNRTNNPISQGRSTALRASTLAAIGGVYLDKDAGADTSLGNAVQRARHKPTLRYLNRAWLESNPRREFKMWKKKKIPLSYAWANWSVMDVYDGDLNEPAPLEKSRLEEDIYFELRRHGLLPTGTTLSKQGQRALAWLGLEPTDYHIGTRTIGIPKQGPNGFEGFEEKEETTIIIDDASNVAKNLQKFISEKRWEKTDKKVEAAKNAPPTAFISDKYSAEYLDYEEFDRIYSDIFVSKEYPWQPDPANPAPHIIDLGSHIGLSTIYWKNLAPGAKITAVEANPETAQVLKRNMKRNHLEGDVTVVDGAVTDHDGTAKLYEPKDGVDFHWGDFVGNTPADPSKYTEVTVPAIRLSSLITGPVDLLKVDIEGSELAALKEAESKLHLVKEMMLEFHINPANPANSLPETLDLLRRQGYNFEVRKWNKPIDIATLDYNELQFLTILAKRP